MIKHSTNEKSIHEPSLPNSNILILFYTSEIHNIIIIIIIIIIIYLSWSWATCWPVPISRIQKSLQRSTMIPSASWRVVFHYPGSSIHHHHHHISVMELGHLLTRSDITYPEVSSKVYHDSFCQLESSISLPWVIYFEAYYYYYF